MINEVAEEEGFDITDQMDITKFLKAKVTMYAPFQLWVFYLRGNRSMH